MSLAVLADHLASRGRNGDTMLVHMTPEEVHGLHALALAHGGRLTINPDTGLVEASFLKKLLPAIAGMALNFIAPGAGLAVSGMLGIGGAAAGAIGTGLLVGGVTGLATGSLRQGIMAGLGAYGGASLAGGLSAAGAAGAQEAAISSVPAEEIANRAAQSGLTEQGYRNILAQQGTTDYLSKGAMDRFTGGISALGSEAGRTAALQGVGGASGAMRAGFAAAGPALTEQTKTPMPSLNQYTGMVRPFTFDPYGQTYTPQEPYKAASGGVVALAGGGEVPDWAADYAPSDPNFSSRIEEARRSSDPTAYWQRYVRQRETLMAIPRNYQQVGSVGGIPLRVGTGPAESSYVWLGNRPISDLSELQAATQKFGLSPEETMQATRLISEKSGSKAIGGDLYSPIFNAARESLNSGYTMDQVYEGAQKNFGVSKADVDAALRYNNVDPQRLSPISGEEAMRMAREGLGNPVQQPGGMAGGGIVALASGGPALPSDIGTYTPEQKADLYNKFLSQGFNDAAIRQAAGAQSDTDWQTLQNLAAQRGSPAVSGAERTVLTSPNWQSLSGQTGIQGLNANIQNFFQTNPNVNYNAINQAAQQYGVDTQDIIRALQTGGGSAAMQTVTTAPDWKSRSGQTGLEGLSSNINMWLAENKQATEKDIRKAMDYWGLNEADIKRATGKSVADLGYKAPATTPTPTPGVESTAPTTVPGYTGQDKTYGGTDVLERVTPAPLGTAGKATQENLTMNQVKDIYQRGGGSLGMPIIPFTPTPLTGGSKAAYDYLMGKGAYPTVPFTPTGEIMRPYAEAVLGVPVDKTRSKLIFDPATRKYIPNPDYVAPKFPNVPGTGAGGQTLVRDPAGNLYTGTAASYFAANPDVKQAYETNNTGMTPEAYAAYHWNTFGKNEGRKGYADTVTPAPVGGGSQESNADIVPFARGGLSDIAAMGGAEGGQFNLGGYSDGGRLLRGPGDGVSDSIPATIGGKQPARLADGEFVIPARIVSEIGNGSTEAGARKLYAMMDRVQRARAKTTGKGKVAKNTRAEKYLPA